MGRMWDEGVLYHAVSSYQLLEAMLHRRLFHPGNRAALLLPDFIGEKYPQWRKLSAKGFFDRVELFPYLSIPHREAWQVAEDALAAYGALGLPPLEAFSRIYIAGAHFYFSLCPLWRGVPFSMFEDAAGALSDPERQREILARKFPRHAALAWELGLFSGENPGIEEVFCCKRAQAPGASLPRRTRDFSVEKALGGVSPLWRRRALGFFLKRRLSTQADTILLTQQFSGLGLLTEEAQRALYRGLGEGLLRREPLLVKRHPDDRLPYGDIFPGAQVVREAFPAELLPYAFRGRRPRRAVAFGSSALANLGDHFDTVTLPLPGGKGGVLWKNPCIL